MVPLKRGALGTAVLDQVVAVGALAAGLDQQVVARVGGREPIRDPAIQRARLAGREAAGLTVLGGAVVAAVEVNAELAGLRRQPVHERDVRRLPGRAPDRRAREGAPVGPHLRLRPREDPDARLAHLDPDLRIAEDRRDPQPGPEAALGLLGGHRGQAEAAGAQADRQHQCQPARGRGREQRAARKAPVHGYRCRPGRDRYSTTSISPCMNGWTAQKKWSVLPGFAVTLRLNVAPLRSATQESPFRFRLP